MKVPEPGFFLKRTDSETQTAILMIVRVNKREVLRYYTRESICPDAWDPEKKRAKMGIKYTEGWQINERLEKFRIFFKTIVRQMIDNKTLPDRAVIKREIDREFFDFILKEGNLIDYFRETIHKMESNKLMTVHGRPYSAGTIKTFKTSIKHLVDFSKVYEREIDFDTIDMNFYYDYLDYFYQKNYSTNGIYMPVKRLKQILRQAEEEKYKVNAAYRSRRFVTPLELVDKIYLKDEEIYNIYMHEYQLFSSEDMIRDRFVLACCTGIRFGDYEKITSSNIFKNEHGEFLKIASSKTNVTAVIPLNNISKSIMEKYNYDLPEVISNTHFNEYIKTIGMDAGIKDHVNIDVTRAGKKTSKSYMKYELIQTHTARRSFATNLFLKGYSPVEIMKITGHKTEREFLKYIRITSEDVAFKIASDPRFNRTITAP